MKKAITAIFVLVVLISSAVKAQTSQPPLRKHSMQGMQQMLKDSLHLNDAQVDSIKIIREQTTGTVMAIKNDTTLTVNQRQEQIKAAREQMKMRMKAVLSKEQMQQLEEMQRNMHKNKMQTENGK